MTSHLAPLDRDWRYRARLRAKREDAIVAFESVGVARSHGGSNILRCPCAWLRLLTDDERDEHLRRRNSVKGKRYRLQHPEIEARAIGAGAITVNDDVLSNNI